jgi:hypothetical protein
MFCAYRSRTKKSNSNFLVARESLQSHFASQFMEMVPIPHPDGETNGQQHETVFPQRVMIVHCMDCFRNWHRTKIAN